MSEGIEALQFRRNGGEVVRFHSFRRNVENRVGHHTYNVCQILRFLMAEYNLRPEVQCTLLMAALDHDIAEWVTGDMPAPTKRKLPSYRVSGVPGKTEVEYKTFREVYGQHEAKVIQEAGIFDMSSILSDEQKRLLKLADSLDGMWQCVDEAKYGNASDENRDCYVAFASYVRDLMSGTSPRYEMATDKTTPEGRLYTYLTQEMERFL